VTAWAGRDEAHPEIFQVIKGLKECVDPNSRTGEIEKLFARQDGIDNIVQGNSQISKRTGQIARFWHLIERDAARRATIFTAVR
jgi:hypothetical protein